MLAVAKAVGIRLAYGIPVFFIVTFAVSMLVNLMPGSPAQAILGDGATPESTQMLNERFGYNLDPFERYVRWLGGLVTGDLGTTLFTRADVGPLVLKRFAVTAQLAVMALVMSLVVAIPLAMVAAIRRGGVFDRISTSVASAVLSVPSFVSAVVLSLIFTVSLRLFPATGWIDFGVDPLRNLWYAFVPALALSVYETAFFFRVMRSDLVGTLREDFVLVARAKGLPTSHIAMRHVLRPSLTSLVTVLGLAIGRLLGGAIIVETFFTVPGIGAEAVAAVAIKDMNLLQAIICVSVIVYVVLFILVDLAYAWIDPRVTVR